MPHDSPLRNETSTMPLLHQGPHATAALDSNGIATLTLHHCGALNIVGTPAITDLCAALRTLATEPALRVLVLRGSGERAFIGGADIGEMVGLDATRARTFIRTLAGLCDALIVLPVPVIARLAGWCLGGGLEVALACDIRIAAPDAMFGMPEVKVGIPSVIHAALLPPLVGASRAGWLLLGGENIDAMRAEQWGLVHELAAAGELDARVQQRAAALAALPPAALRSQKRLLRHLREVTPAQAVADSVDDFAAAYDSGEPQRLMGEFMARKVARAKNQS
jgi:enoyl-CoA hydratase/carnithine racemase